MKFRYGHRSEEWRREGWKIVRDFHKKSKNKDFAGMFVGELIERRNIEELCCHRQELNIRLGTKIRKLNRRIKELESRR